MTDRRIFAVTAASGHVGGYAARALLEQGHVVRAMGRHMGRLQGLVDSGAEPWIGDLHDASYVEKAVTGVDGALLIVPPHPAAVDFQAYQNEIAAVFAAAAPRSGLKQAVFISVLGASDDRAGGLIAGHADIERHLNGVPGLNVVHLRPSGFMEFFYYLLKPLREEGVLRSPIGPHANLELVAARDVGRSAAAILVEGHIRNVGFFDLPAIRSVTLSEVARLIGQGLGRPVTVEQYTHEEDIRDLMAAGTGKTFATMLNETWAMMNAMGEMPPLDVRPVTAATYSIEDFVKNDLVPAILSSRPISDFSTATRPRPAELEAA